jgi:hypothetical protein
VVDVGVHASERELDSGDLDITADSEHRLPAARTGRARERCTGTIEVQAREPDIALREPCRIGEAAADPWLDRLCHRQVQAVKHFSPSSLTHKPSIV